MSEDVYTVDQFRRAHFAVLPFERKAVRVDQDRYMDTACRMIDIEDMAAPDSGWIPCLYSVAFDDEQSDTDPTITLDFLAAAWRDADDRRPEIGETVIRRERLPSSRCDQYTIRVVDVRPDSIHPFERVLPPVLSSEEARIADVIARHDLDALTNKGAAAFARALAADGIIQSRGAVDHG